MNLQTKIFVAALLVVLLAVTVWVAWPAGPPPETKDRLSPEAIEQMVERPMVAVRQKGLPSGIAVFERQLTLDRSQYGSGSVRVADLLTAFGVELYTEGSATENEAEMRTARDYLRDAIPVYRKAFGPGSPEVAVALHSFADADIAIHDNRLTPEAEAALVEALRIRRAALGPDNRETQATEARLAHARARKDAPRWPASSAGRALEEAEDAVPE